ncbi:MAG: diadenylate cyclase CdaA [Eubacteriales bacterium]|nr:diadenylate cyclase CdaA [Eubacteriales bacterium]
MEQIKEFADRYLTHIQFIKPMDMVEIILISLLVYYLMVFIKNTRAWQLLKGVFIILLFLLLAELLQMDTIVWIASNAFQLGAIALIVVLQPELRQALEQLGKKNLIHSILPFETVKSEAGLFSDQTVRELVKGCTEMSRVKTGALIVVWQNDPLTEYERTGIAVDGIVTSQLLINIFEKNTPLHDGAVIVRGDRVTYATCYLPLSDNMQLSKELGTRHRAGVGISEVTDSMTIIVSEENGKISVAYKGQLSRGLSAGELEEKLRSIQNKPAEEKEHKRWKGWFRNEKMER